MKSVFLFLTVFSFSVFAQLESKKQEIKNLVEKISVSAEDEEDLQVLNFVLESLNNAISALDGEEGSSSDCVNAALAKGAYLSDAVSYCKEIDNVGAGLCAKKALEKGAYLSDATSYCKEIPGLGGGICAEAALDKGAYLSDAVFYCKEIQSSGAGQCVKGSLEKGSYLSDAVSYCKQI